MSILKIRDADGNVQEIPVIKGDKGDAYVLTEQDKRDIASMAADMLQNGIPSAEEVEY